MERRGREAKPFRAARHGRVIDGLDVSAVRGEQRVRYDFTGYWIADESLGVDARCGRLLSREDI